MEREKEIGFQIRVLSNLIRRDVEKDLPSGGKINSGQRVHGWAIDYFYENRGKDIFQKDFEEKFSIRRSTASNMLRLMEKNDYIRRESVESDARLKKIVITEKAVNLHEKIRASIEARELRMRRGLTDEEIEEFFRIARQIKENLENGE